MPAVATSDGAGVKLNRTIGGPVLDNFDPFLLLDEFGSEEGADYIGGFPDHPHRGFETVTYMLNGLMRHEDSTGASGTLGPGSIQWMTAGRGIVHSEMPEQEEGLMRGFQLWVNLPAAEKMCAPRYQNIEPGDIPEVMSEDGVRIRVIAGEVDGTRGAVSGIAVEPTYLDITLPEGGEHIQPLASGHAAFYYVFEGEVSIIASDEGAVVEVPHGGSSRVAPRFVGSDCVCSFVCSFAGTVFAGAEEPVQHSQRHRVGIGCLEGYVQSQLP